jgi:hypothetical protein
VADSIPCQGCGRSPCPFDCGGWWQTCRTAGRYGYKLSTTLWSSEVRRALAAYVPTCRTILDLGCGPDAAVLIELANMCEGECRLVGVELHHGYGVSAKQCMSNAGVTSGTVVRADLASELPFSFVKTERVFVYSFIPLRPQGMRQLRERLWQILPPSSLWAAVGDGVAIAIEMCMYSRDAQILYYQPPFSLVRKCAASSDRLDMWCLA